MANCKLCVRLEKMQFCCCFPQYHENVSQVRLADANCALSTLADSLLGSCTPPPSLTLCWVVVPAPLLLTLIAFPLTLEEERVQLLTEAVGLLLSSSSFETFFLTSCILKLSCYVYKYLRTLYPFLELIFLIVYKLPYPLQYLCSDILLEVSTATLGFFDFY